MKEVKKNLQRFNKIAKETGSVTLFVLIAVLFFVVILLTVYTSSKNTLNAQEKEIAKIRAEYDITDSELDQAYSEKLEELNQDISITFTTATTGKTFHNTIDWTNENLKVGITFLAEGNPQNSKVVITDSTGTRTINCEVFLNGNNIIEKNCTIKVIASNGTTTTTTKTVKVSRIDKIKPIVEIEQKKQDFLIKKGTSVEVTAKINKAEDAAATQDSGSSGIKTLRYIWTTNQDVNQIVDPESKWQEISKAGDVTATFDGGEEKSNGEIKQTYYLLVEAIDNAGNSTKDILKDGITIEEDTKVPDTPSITNSSNGNWTNKDVTVILQSKDNLELSHFIVKKEDGTWEKVADAVNGKGTITYKDEMDKTFTYKAVDTSGNESGEMTTIVRIDKTNPTVPTYKAFYSDGSGNYTSGTWINKEVRTQITAKDNLSGTPGVHSGVVEMYYSTNKTQWTKFNLSISNGVQNDNTDNTIYTGTEKWDLKNRNDTYYFKVKDQAGNESEISTEFNVKYDIDKPTITVNPTNVNAVREANVAITVGDTGGSGLDSTNSYQYQISTSNTAVPTGTWLNYTSGAENTIGTGLTGTYYLWVKEIKDVVTNISQESGTKVSNYHVFGKYVFDNKAPTITFGTDGSTTYKKSQSTTVTATDNGEAGIDLNSLKYQWTQSTTAPGESSFSSTFSNGGTITKSDGNWGWYLWILAKDNLGNTTIQRSNAFYIDNTSPVIELNGTPSATLVNSATTFTIPLKVTDTASGVNNDTFTASDIYVDVGNSSIITPTTKTLTYIGTSSGIYSYTLTLSGITGTGSIYLAFQKGSIADNAGNTCKETRLTSETSAYQPSIEYMIHCSNTWWNTTWYADGATGGTASTSANNIECIKVRNYNMPPGLELRVNPYIADVGWLGYIPADGESSIGTIGFTKTLQSVKFMLSDTSLYKVEYRVYQNGAWTSWVNNAAPSGVTGQNLPIKAIQVQITPISNTGTLGGSYAMPTAEITPHYNRLRYNESTPARISLESGTSGISYSSCKYVIDTTASYTTDASIWDSATAFTATSQTITVPAVSSPSSRYIHVLAVDNDGNKNVISKNVTTGVVIAREVSVLGCQALASATVTSFPVWTNYNGQDDLIWHTATSNYYLVKKSEHNGETGAYTIQAYNGSTAVGGTGTEIPTYSSTWNPDTLPYLPNNTWVPTENTSLATGKVMQDSTGNEYTWVAVPKSVTSSSSTTTAIETTLQTYASAYRDSLYTDTYYSGCGYSNATEYNNAKSTMLNSIKKNGGFWVGKYETGSTVARTSSSATITTPVIKQDIYPYNYVTQTQAQSLASGMQSGRFNSDLMFGIQWDLMLKYLEVQGDKTQAQLKTNSIEWGNYMNATFNITRGKYSSNNGTTWTPTTSYTKPVSTPTLLTTGITTRNNAKNIYDIAGNVWEKTFERYINNSTDSPSSRGGAYNNNGHACPVFMHDYNGLEGSTEALGFRTTIY